MAKILKEELADLNPLVIQGSVDAKERIDIVNELQGERRPALLIMTEAGTYGLNLQAAPTFFITTRRGVYQKSNSATAGTAWGRTSR
jgi:SNF2 family DNA or RNA helicase